MKKFLIAVIVCLCASVSVMAQSSMTDDQVLQYIIREHSAGVSQATIVTKLMQKGVDISQIRRIRQKYQQQLKEKGAEGAADAAVTEAGNMMRKNNGQMEPATTNAKKNVATQTVVDSDKPTVNSARYTNKQDELTVDDVIMLQKYLLNQETLSETQFFLADITNDGDVNIYDFIALKQTIFNQA